MSQCESPNLAAVADSSYCHFPAENVMPNLSVVCKKLKGLREKVVCVCMRGCACVWGLGGLICLNTYALNILLVSADIAMRNVECFLLSQEHYRAQLAFVELVEFPNLKEDYDISVHFLNFPILLLRICLSNSKRDIIEKVGATKSETTREGGGKDNCHQH
jgi:hypothetical protein